MLAVTLVWQPLVELSHCVVIYLLRSELLGGTDVTVSVVTSLPSQPPKHRGSVESKLDENECSIQATAAKKPSGAHALVSTQHGT